MEAREIIERFGGQTVLGEAIGKGQSTVGYWAKTGVIPARWQPKLLMLALKRGLKLTASDFVDAPKLEIEAELDRALADLGIQNEPVVTPSSEPPDSEVQTTTPLSFTVGDKQVPLRVEGQAQAIWATTNDIAEIFEVDSTGILKHIQNIFSDEELSELATTAKFAVVQTENGRSVRRSVAHYNLDVILSVGYRVNAKRATAFRQWATQTLRAYLDQGYVINEEALRESPEKLNRLAAQIRSIRSEERQVYAKVRECFKISSSDYDAESRHVKSFYALLQDKFHHAVTGSTAAKLVMDRADHRAENMGLFSMKGETPTISDATAGKNYLTPDELYRLHILSEQFLLYAEGTALAGKKMTMESLHRQLDRLLTLNDYPIFDGYRDYLKDRAIQHARMEYGLFKKRRKIESMGLEYDEEALEAGEYDGYLISD